MQPSWRALRSDGAKTVLLTLGRLPVALDLARGFSANGWRVIVAEPFRLHLCRMSKAVDASRRVTAPATDPVAYRQQLLDIVARDEVDLVVPVSEETGYVASLAAELPAGTSLFAPSAADVARLHDKYTFIEWARGLGLPVPTTWLADDDDHRRLTEAGPFVVKPRDACSGTGVRVLPAGATVRPGRDRIVQERLEGRLVSTFTIARDGVALVTSAYEATVLSGSVAVAFRRVEDADVAGRWIRQFVEASRHTGFIAFDIIIDDAGVARAIECNPRATSGIHFIRHRALPGLIDAAEGAAVQATGRLYRDETRLAESYSCFTTALGRLGRADGRSTWRELRAARDVTWRANDPWPFLLMMVNTWRIVWLAATRRLSFAQAAVLDISWRRDDRQDAP